jgi:K+/H+ antiporter YhaU regulatory subunit KhtT
VVAVERDDQVHANPGPEFRLVAGDLLVLIGSAAEAAAARAVVTGS